MRKRAGFDRAIALYPEMDFLGKPAAGPEPIGAAAFDRFIWGRAGRAYVGRVENGPVADRVLLARHRRLPGRGRPGRLVARVEPALTLQSDAGPEPGRVAQLRRLFGSGGQ